MYLSIKTNSLPKKQPDATFRNMRAAHAILLVSGLAMLSMIWISITLFPSPQPMPSNPATQLSVSSSPFDHFALETVAEPTQVVMGVSEGAKSDPRGYGVKGIMKFAKSLFDTGFDGYVVIATDHFSKVAPAVVEMIRSQYDIEKRLILINVDDYRIGFLHDMHPKELRYYLYALWSAKFTGEGTKVLITDVRDVVFQNNPFDRVYWAEAERDKDLFFFYESEAITLGNSDYNSKWIKRCFGQDVLSELYDNYVICSGTTVGTAKSIERYSRRMVLEMASNQWTKCRRDTHDQIFHNYLYAKGEFGPVQVFRQGHGPANSIGKTPKYDFIDPASSTVLNEDGTPSALVHQYDRHVPVRERVRAFIRNKYASY